MHGESALTDLIAGGSAELLAKRSHQRKVSRPQQIEDSRKGCKTKSVCQGKNGTFRNRRAGIWPPRGGIRAAEGRKEAADELKTLGALEGVWCRR